VTFGLGHSERRFPAHSPPLRERYATPEAVGRKDRHLRRPRVNFAVGPRLVRGLRSVRFSGELRDPHKSISVRLSRPDGVSRHRSVQDRPHASTPVVSGALADGLFVPKPTPRAVTVRQDRSWPARGVRPRRQACVHVHCDRYSVITLALRPLPLPPRSVGSSGDCNAQDSCRPAVMSGE
jgi:hypothetical protein